MLIVTGVFIGFVLVVMVGQTVRTMQGTGWVPITPIDITLPVLDRAVARHLPDGRDDRRADRRRGLRDRLLLPRPGDEGQGPARRRATAEARRPPAPRGRRSEPVEPSAAARSTERRRRARGRSARADDAARRRGGADRDALARGLADRERRVRDGWRPRRSCRASSEPSRSSTSCAAVEGDDRGRARQVVRVAAAVRALVAMADQHDVVAVAELALDLADLEVRGLESAWRRGSTCSPR